MPKSVSWRELVRRLKVLGFVGPEWGGRHPFMNKGDFRLRIPNDHGTDIRPALLKALLRQAGISIDQWERT